MSIYKLQSSAIEESTFVILVEIKDEDAVAITPLTFQWSLQDTNKNYINSREDVSVSSPTSSESIVLQGDDLALSQNDNRRRIFTTEVTYSGTYGASVPLKKSCEFRIDNLIKIV